MSIKYRYKYFFLPFVFFGAFLSLSIWFGVAEALITGWWQGLVLFSVSAGISALISWIIVLGLADIYITDNGIYRPAFGIVWQRMTWTAVREIHVALGVNPENGEKVRSFLLKATRDSPFFSRRISFQERRPEMDDLLAGIKKYAIEHEITIVDKVGGFS